MKNRGEVVDRCIAAGINCIDFAGDAEPETYCRVLRGRRDAMYLCYSHPASELREPANCTTPRLVELFEAGLKRCGLEYADVWRLMAYERGGDHSQADVDAMIEALRIAKQKGLCRHTGFSTHDAQVGSQADRDLLQSNWNCSACPTRSFPSRPPRTACWIRSASTMSECSASSRLPVTRCSKGTDLPTVRHAEEDDRRRAGHPPHPQQSRHHRTDSWSDQHASGGQRGGRRSANHGVDRRRAGGTG